MLTCFVHVRIARIMNLSQSYSNSRRKSLHAPSPNTQIVRAQYQCHTRLHIHHGPKGHHHGMSFVPLQLGLRAIPGLEVVGVSRHVALGRDRVCGGWQPDHREPKVSIPLALFRYFGPPALVMRLPIECLQPQAYEQSDSCGTGCCNVAEA